MKTNASIPPDISGPARVIPAAIPGRRLRQATRSLALAALLVMVGPAPSLANADSPASRQANSASSAAGAPTTAAGSATPLPATGATTLDPESDRRLRALSAELRCLVCQNQTLADSNAELAVDLRRQVETMIARGDSDAQIKTYLVDRYGDFVLYRPPVQGNTAFLWFGPFALLGVGAIVWIFIQRRSRRAETPSPSRDDESRARALLDD